MEGLQGALRESGREAARRPATPPRNWAASTAELRRSLKASIPASELKSLHRITPLKHFLVTGYQAAVLVLLAWALVRISNPLFWIPLSLLLGLTLFNFTVLLHEVVHKIVFQGKRKRLMSLLGWLYAVPSGISKSQFTRWHLDHHAELGTSDRDPKRHRLSPKRNARWFKLLYFTPALIPIYFRAAAKETKAYDAPLRRRIRVERAVAVLIHLAAAGAIAWFFGGYALVRLYLVPYLFGFPMAFALNRLGQHYDVDPSDPARWGTRIRRSLFWDWAFLWSGYHLEHHYFPGVPLYNLRKLNRLLTPFFEKRGVPARSYSWLLWQWLVHNREPHTKWA